MNNRFDVFISHNSRDKLMITEIAQRLRDKFGIRPWLDDWYIPAGDKWEPEIRRALSVCGSCAVFLSGSGWGENHLEEALLAVEKNAQQPEFRVIPVLLPGAKPKDMERLGSFFQETHWVDFRSDLDDKEKLRRFVGAITGKPPGPASLTIFTIEEAAERWRQSLGQDKELLYTGHILREAINIAKTHSNEVREDVKTFLKISTSEEQRQKRIQWYITAVSFVIAVLAVYAIIQQQEAIKQARIADQQRQEAEKQRSLAEDNAKNAEAQQRVAEVNAAEAKRLRIIAEDRQKEAEEQRKIAEKNEREANKQRQIANALRQIAIARQFELQADASLSDRNIPAAQILLAKALTLDDRPQTRERLLEVEAKGSPRLVWSDSLKTGILSVAISPDAHWIASACNDNTIRLFEADTGKQVRILRGHEDAVTCVAFNSNGQLASGSEDKTIKLWDIQNGKLIRTQTGHEEMITSIAFSPDGRRLASRSLDLKILVWDVDSGDIVLSQMSTGIQSGIAFSPDGQWIATEGFSQELWLYGVEDTKTIRIFKGDRAPIGSLSFSHDGKLIASAGGSSIRLWDVEKAAQTHILSGHRNLITGLAFAPDGKRIISGSIDGTTRLWDIDTRKAILTLGGHQNRIMSVASGTNGLVVFGDIDGTIQLWITQSNSKTVGLQGHKGLIRCLVFSPDGTTVASGSFDQTARIWDTKTGALKHTIRPGNLNGEAEPSIHISINGSGPITSLSFSPDGKSLALSNMEEKVRLYDTSTWKEIRTFNSDAGAIISLSFSPTENLMASGGAEGKIGLWNVETGTEVRLLDHSDDAVLVVTFSPDGRWLASGGGDGVVRLWDVNSGKQLQEFTGHEDAVSALAISPDKQWLVSAEGIEGNIMIWDINNGRKLTELHKEGLIASLAFSPDGKMLVWPSQIHQAIRVLNLTTLSTEGSFNLRAGEGTITTVAFSPDGQALAYGGEDSLVHIQDLAVINHVQGSTPEMLLQQYQGAYQLKVEGPSISQIPQQQLSRMVGNKHNATFALVSNSSPDIKTWGNNWFRCPDAPSVPTLNPFPITYGKPGQFCVDLPPLRARLNRGEYPKNQQELEQGVTATSGDEIQPLIYINNGADETLPAPFQTTAKNLRVRTLIDKTVGAQHTISVSFAGDNTNIVFSSIRVRTGPRDKLVIIPYSGVKYNYKGKALKSKINIGNNVIALGDLPAGFDKSFFLTFKLKVVSVRR